MELRILKKYKYSFCGDDRYTETVHNYDEGEIIPATCIAWKKIKRTCKNCGYVDISNAVENDYEVGDLLKFGAYPQSEVKNEALIAALNELGGDNSNWTSYNYYSGTGEYNDGQMQPSDYMRYIDVTYEDTINVEVIADEEYGEELADMYPQSEIELYGTRKVYKKV